MFKSILIRNFQSHKKTQLELSSGINCIIGPSNNGKTAALRAINWAINNEPSGLSFVSDWDRDKDNEPIKSTLVRIENDKHIIERRRGKIEEKKFNGYIIDNEKKLEAIGQTIPEEITSIFNMDSVNIQKQMDAPFLLSESAGEVARFFNKIIRLDLIDRVLSRAEIKRRDFNKEKLLLEKESLEVIKEIEVFEWIDNAKKLLNRMSMIEERIRDNTTINDDIKKLVEEYKDNNELIKNNETILSAIPLINKITDLQKVIDELVNNSYELESAIQEYKEYDRIIKEAIDFNKIDKMIIVIDELRISIFEKVKQKDALQEMINEYNSLLEEIKEYGIEIKKLEKLMPDRCPYCNSLLKENK